MPRRMLGRNSALALILMVVPASPAQDSTVESGATVHENNSSGTFAPAGPPSEAPVRIEAGKSCIVDLKQPYTIGGTLSGNLEVDYRILVAGPCGSRPGTFAEDWIAHGTFSGTVDGRAASASFTYVAHVQAGGEVEGQIVFGQGLDGKLEVRGQFNGGKLSYSGVIN